ncbi:FecR family protein [Janthinobacterium sp.]|uniref:FecR family protein n=1 Tax=Janthinobacterium sp. TaxID=1871054 RepID=UPI00293D8C05|nr:FecR domain-containing protein [Janthinobacterium sp.]
MKPHTDTPTAARPPTGQAEAEARAWLILLDSGRVDARQAGEFRRWCALSPAHATAFAQARRVWQALPEAGRGLARRAPEPSGWRRWLAAAPPHAGRRAFLGGAVAASLAYLALRPPLELWPAIGELAADYHTGTGEQRAVDVAGLATVQMNTQTRINVGAAGIELLAGEAEVEAGPGAPFSVAAAGATLTARAARFNVRRTGDGVCVSCLSGQVEILRGGERLTLGARRQLRYDAAGLGEGGAVDAAVSAWRQRMLVFNQAPLALVVEEINRYRPGKIVLLSAALGRQLVQANFYIDRLDDVAALIGGAYGARVTRLPGGIVLLGQAIVTDS